MAGILNKKTRFIDLVVTDLGKKAAAKGKFSPVFASFTDKDCFYDKTETNAKNVADESKIYLETISKSDIDRILYDTDDSGMLFINSQMITSGTSVIGNKIFATNPEKESLSTFLTGSVFSEIANKIISGSTQNFKKNKLISSFSDFEQANNFKINVTNQKKHFVLTNSSPFLRGPTNKVTHLDNADPLMFDNKLAHFRNFQYLPPTNTDNSAYGRYKDLRSTTRKTYEDIKKDLRISSLDYDYLTQNNTVSNEIGNENLLALNREKLTDVNTQIAKEKIELFFNETSTLSNVLTQIYEKDTIDGKLKKLDIVDAGEFLDESDSERLVKRVFYVGKVYNDSNNYATFLNLFTLIWD